MTDGAPGTDGATYAWAPSEPTTRKNRSGLWIGIPAGATAVALIAASLVLIAPGASVAGVQIGGLTAGAAAQAISTRLADTAVVVESPAGEVTVTGADLGATVDAAALADKAFADNPMWKPAAWFPEGAGVAVQIDESAATAPCATRPPRVPRARRRHRRLRRGLAGLRRHPRRSGRGHRRRHRRRRPAVGLRLR